MNDHISKPLNEAALLRVLAQYYRPTKIKISLARRCSYAAAGEAAGDAVTSR